MIRVVKKKSYSKRRAEDYVLKRKLKFFISKFTRIFQVILVIAFVAFLVWTFKYGGNEKIAEFAYNRTNKFLISFGLRIESVEIKGNKTVPTGMILEKIFSSLGDITTKSIILLDLDRMKEEITSIGWVETVDIKKKLPGKIIINITERSPKLLWQNSGKVWLADEFGHLLTEKIEKRYIYLPIVIGYDSAKDIPDLYNIITSSKKLFGMIKGASKIGNRRWDITLNNGIKIKLPEENARASWMKLEELVSKNSLFSKNINYIDMRIEDQIITGMAEEKKDEILESQEKIKSEN